ncbi:MAG TPA: methyltransferase domain-containing protein, partial [Spirochaetales bacterium]|nr:methyltransferase domain-containing protein [Spirochaetales bacterium]
MKRILLVPSVRKGNGSGHLVRCFALAKALGPGACLYLSDNADPQQRTATELALSYPQHFEQSSVCTSIASGERFDLVIVDNRATPYDELERWASLGPVVCIDEGGPARSYAEYLVDILPRAQSGRKAIAPNLAGSEFLDLPKHRRTLPERIRTVLISFGGEDPVGLTDRFLTALLASAMVEPSSISVVRGPLYAGKKSSGTPCAGSGVTELGQVQNLKEHLASYDLVVCSFGLTAFEAAWAGCLVLLYNPSAEHDRLSIAAGFPMLKRGAGETQRLTRLLASVDTLGARSAACAPASRKDLALYIKTMDAPSMASCPICEKRLGKALARYERKTYIQCPVCGLVRMAYFQKRETTYTNDTYFFDSYKAQYGKTYLEDLPALRRMAARRLSVIESVIKKSAYKLTPVYPSVLDVGCAYGAFVAEAQARSWSAVGSDVSSAAIAYVRDTVGAPAFVADFSAPMSSGFYPRELDCVTMWYVIEHFDRLGAVLTRVSSLLKDGGVFAFSTPSGSGISARKNLVEFLDRSPDDHYTVLSPVSIRGILARYGFAVQRIVVTGHHPERFP